MSGAVPDYVLEIARDTAWKGGAWDEAGMEEIAMSFGCTVKQIVDALGGAA